MTGDSPSTKKKLVWVFHDNKWCKGYVKGKTNKKAKVYINNGETVVKDTKWIMGQKYNGRSFRSRPPEVLIKYGRCKPRPPKKIEIKSMEFKSPGEHGDIGFHCENPEYESKLQIYNDNGLQFLNGDLTAGGGNGIGRIYRLMRSMGIPTGNRGGFSSLSETVFYEGHILTAKQLIDMSIEDIVLLILYRDSTLKPFDTIYYCTDSISKQRFSEIGKLHNIDPIGIRIFSNTIGKDVVNYITQQIKALPMYVHKERLKIRQGCTDHYKKNWSFLQFNVDAPTEITLRTNTLKALMDQTGPGK